MPESLRKRVPEDWSEVLGEQLDSDCFAGLSRFVAEERRNHTIFPPEDLTFAALDETPFDQVRAVILGQDPYHGEGQAHGLAFSVKPGIPIPPSLRNILIERRDDLGLDPPDHGYLLPWARRGVLLLNTVLTVRAGAAHSHRGRGWETLTDAVIRHVSERRRPVVFLLWGKPAQKKRELIDTLRHTVIAAAHPSPLSAHRGFFGSRPFSRTNDALRSWGDAPIDWSLPKKQESLPGF